jgi:hypothetical protein
MARKTTQEVAQQQKGAILEAAKGVTLAGVTQKVTVHCWCWHVPFPRTDEELAQLVATVAEGLRARRPSPSRRGSVISCPFCSRR